MEWSNLPITFFRWPVCTARHAWSERGMVALICHMPSQLHSVILLGTALPVLGTVWPGEGGADGLIPLSSSQFYGRDFKSKEKTLLGFPSKPLTILVSTPLWYRGAVMGGMEEEDPSRRCQFTWKNPGHSPSLSLLIYKTERSHLPTTTGVM